MSNSDDPLIFHGRSSEEAETFIRQVNLLAFKANRMRDKRWTADFAATAFAGDALRKFRRLPSEVRGDWDKLQEALLNEYSPASAPPGAAAAPPAYGTSIPTPAAGPNQFSNPYASFSRSGTFTGRIKFSTASGSISGYLSRYLDRSTGLLVITQNPSQALQLRWSPSGLMTTFEALNCDSPYKFLGGVTRDSRTQFGHGSSESLALTTTTGPESAIRGHSRTYQGRPTNGVAYAGIWNILQDGTVIAVVRVEDTSYALSPMLSTNSDTISEVACPKTYLAARPPGERSEVKLVFEPL
ncbi:hypothetical protein M407DRAFT_244489 [Tulasnella calospora MUT 4182]|uniref:Uncharacterized protein n=1 Tax=Tulasnella calospora MUT 4182 TaxID=1051891 RepID=A0A0C3Q5D3_9AGAM|nr:hypothetical protein M407DRAFT_244489 [Tulasnella calospora MUT 4182]